MITRMASRPKFLVAFGLIAAVLAAFALFASISMLTADVRPKKGEVEFRVVHNVELKHGHAIEVTFSDDRQTRTLAHGDFTSIQEGHFIAGPFETATSGDLKLAVALVDQGGTKLATGVVNLPLKPDRRYGVWVIIGSGDPTAGCLGCAGSRSFPLDPALGYAPDVALAVVWGSNSISNPVAY